jgi:hypothetical protein
MQAACLVWLGQFQHYGHGDNNIPGLVAQRSAWQLANWPLKVCAVGKLREEDG